MSYKLNVEKIKQYNRATWMGSEIVCYDEIGSTNVEAAKLAEQGWKHGTLVVADSQNGGKGRRGRSWYTPESTAIAMSFLLKPQWKPEYAPMLTLVQAMAVAEAIEEVCGIMTQIKWPNDILVNEKKVCGILTEMNLCGTKIASVIIGTGINVNQDDFPQELSEIATSLKKETKYIQCREELIAAICKKFETYYEEFTKSKNLSYVKDAYNTRLISAGRSVRVLDPKGEYTGEAMGINDQGELLVKKEDGNIVNVYAGEVSVRGVYGYV